MRGVRAVPLLLILAACLILPACATSPTIAVEQHKVYVLGSVTKQVMIEYREGMTLLEACSYAGFPNGDARTCRVSWADKSGLITQRRCFSYNDITDGTAQNLPVHPGDIIYFSRTPFAVLMDFVQRLLQPISAIFRPVASVGTTGVGAVAGTAAAGGTTAATGP